MNYETKLRPAAVIGLFILSLPAQPAAISEKCISCHPTQVQSYLQTGMGRSMSRNTAQPADSFRHSASGSQFTVSVDDSGMRQRIDRGGLHAEYPVEYVIGSGHASFGYLIRVGDHLFQSPIAYYPQDRAWEMAPGFQNYSAPDFNRPVTAECLWCHAGQLDPVPDTVNRYHQPAIVEETISCDRCHGPPERHLENPSSDTILNPRKLSPVARDSVCEQCHLGGDARVLNPGRDFGDFEPGMALEEVFSVYHFDYPRDTSAPGAFRVVSHSEQLALSRCAQASGERMWCGACHDPHERPEDAAAYYRRKCLECHGEELVARHAKPAGDCVACHMAKRRSDHSGRSDFTDHHIAVRPREWSEAPAGRLRAWREPAGLLAPRNLGLAYVQIGQQQGSLFHLNEGFRLLSEVEDQFPGDARLLSAKGLVIMLKDYSARPDLLKLALSLFQSAMENQPKYALHYPMLAAAWREAGSSDKAVAVLEQAIELDPLLESAYAMLAQIHQQAGRPERARQTWRLYLEQMPQSLEARRALATLQETTRP